MGQDGRWQPDSPPLKGLSPGLHATSVLVASVFGPVDLALSALGTAVQSDLLEVVALMLFVPVVIAGFMFAHATRGAIIGDRSPRGMKVELEIWAFQTELVRDRSLRSSIESLGLNARPFLSLRWVALVLSLLVAIGSTVIG